MNIPYTRRSRVAFKSESDINDKVSYPPCAFPASILLILEIGTGAVQGRYQKTRLGAGFSVGNWLFFDFSEGTPLVCSTCDTTDGIINV